MASPSFVLTPEQAALVVPLLQKLTASGHSTQELQPTQELRPTREGASIADMFRKKKRNTKSTPAQIFLHVSYK